MKEIIYVQRTNEGAQPSIVDGLEISDQCEKTNSQNHKTELRHQLFTKVFWQTFFLALAPEDFALLAGAACFLSSLALA